MFKSYFKTAYRFLLKNKTFSFINIIGLAIGTLCCLYILLYVQEQYSYDKHHKNVDGIYRITTSLTLPGGKHNSSSSSPAIAPSMKQDFGEVEQFTRVVTADIEAKRHLLRYKEKSIYEKNAAFVDSTFFDVFTYHFVAGSPTKALSEPFSVVLLKTTADKLFGDIDPIGKMIEIDNNNGKHDFKVNGVVDESLGKTHIHANMFLSMNSNGMGQYTLNNNSWAGNNYAYSYVKLLPNTNASLLENKLPTFLNKHGGDQLKNLGMTKVLHLQPITSIHTTNIYEHESDKTVSKSFLYILLLIAALIQIIACINFMNLSTARASKRAKEVGVRKVIGAERGDLIKQFIGESILLSLLGVFIALPLLLAALPFLNDLTQANIKLSFLADYRLWLVMFALVLVTGFFAGSYPAFYLSAFKAVKVIKGNFTNHISATGLRRSLVVFQFVLSIVLIIGIIIIYSQLNYIKNKDLGFEKDQKLIFSFYTDDAKAKIPSLMNDLRQLPEVKAVSKANNFISQFVPNDWVYFLEGGNVATGQDIQFMFTDEYFAKASGLQLVSGRDFRLGDSTKVLINETMAKRLGLDPATAPGTKLYPQQDPGEQITYVEVVGVMKDFNYNSLHDDIKPFMLRFAPNGLQGWNISFSNVIVNTSSTNYKSLLGKMSSIWNKDVPGVPFEYNFLDDEIQKQYESEMTLARIINSFTLMAILISCLGLFGLAAFSAEQRNKEIGIRKVLGASVSGIVQLLSKDFLKLVFIAMLIASPIAWWAMSKWLQDFAYKVSISWWMFAVAGALAIFIALFTISFQAIKAAIANPIKSLRSE
ncbi:ABC transporter permease [Chitinophagaceae bacterium LWZ2-11]